MTSGGPEHHLTDTLLAGYPLPDEVRWGIAEAGFVFATPIQAKTLPITLAGRDVAGQAQTGTGKTAAFLITIFTRLLEKKPAHRAPGPPGPGGRSDPRARRADPRGRRSARAPHGPGHARGLRRDGLPAAARPGEDRAGRPRGNAGPTPRLRAAGRRHLSRRPDPRHRRGRPDVRHGVHPGPASDPAALSALPPAADASLLGHAVAARDGARLRAHEQRREGRDRARARGGARHHRSALPRRRAGEVPPAPRPAREGGRQPRSHLRQPPDHGGRPRARALGQRLSRPARSPATFRRTGA